MDINKEAYDKTHQINVWPTSGIYIIICLISVFMGLMIIILPFWLLFSNEPVNFWDFGYINEGYIQFLITLPISVFITIIFLKTGIFNFKVSFTKTQMIVPRLSEIQEKRIMVICNEIMTCEAKTEGLHYFFVFNCIDGKTIKLFIMRFSFKQLELILQLIQERGGLTDQNINEIINPLRIKKKF
jgi:hypothetical protein